MKTIYATSVFILSLLFIAIPASAHDVQYAAIKTTITLHGASADFETIAPESISAGDSTTTEEEKNEIMSGVFAQAFEVKQGEEVCSITVTSIQNIEEPVQSVFKGTLVCPQPIDVKQLKVTSQLFADIFPSYDHFVTFVSGGNSWQLAFNPEHQIYPDNVELIRQSSPLGHFMSVAWQFLWMGMMHIFTGYDHILFLIATILLIRSPRKILIVVTSFTIAHTITLLLASFGKITVSPAIVEPLIALSIIYMALRNVHFLWFKKEHEHIAERWITTFAFGLVHGLGFAGSLADTKIPQEFFVSSLVSFNVGIELGQLVILAVLVPLLLDIDKNKRRSQILLIVSTVITVVALFWFVQRIM